MNKLKRIFWTAVLLCATNAWAADGGLQSILAQNNIRCITFSDNDMVFKTFDGTETVYSLDNVEKLVFDILDIPTNTPAVNADINIYTADGAVVVQCAGSVKSLTLLNINGKVVEKRRDTSLPASINVSALPAGIYLLQIETADGIITKKIIKQ
ncbi:MAG: T9SS type A sorting domain-containing protein [Prevotellaceae bacterium]|jgi:hypothetical protein|nr:T9SS type A sorting domain-containing protein [Prevotellaceae bacterium]